MPTQARRIAIKNGLRYAYTGTVHDVTGGSANRDVCGQAIVARDWFVLVDWQLTGEGAIKSTGPE